jgi:serpin B
MNETVTQGYIPGPSLFSIRTLTVPSFFPFFRVAIIVVAVGISAASAATGDAPASAVAGKPTAAADVVADNTAFAVDLHKYLANTPGNLFFSPLSISKACAMTYAGACGETADEMRRTLHFSFPNDRFHPVMGALLAEKQAADAPYRMSMANALWGQKDYPFDRSFLARLADDYQGGLQLVDFVASSEPAREAINKWAEDHTSGRIKNLLSRDSVSPDTRLVLTNAVYFKGNWLRRFERERTYDATFQVNATETCSVPLMSQEGLFGYSRDADCRVIELPYAGEAISMILILPEAVDGLSRIERNLTADWLKQRTGGLRQREVRVEIPRFRLTKTLELSKTLADLGMPRAFDMRADFSGMSEGRGEPLHISQVRHKAFVDVNEEGTEAAAATAVVLETKSARQETFRADHPFLFVIRDVRSGSILFLGRLSDPQSGGTP